MIKLAVGDALIDILGTDTNFQPAAGVEVCITEVGSNGTSATSVDVYDGTTTSVIGATSHVGILVKIFITNSNYIRGTGVANHFYSGVQTK